MKCVVRITAFLALVVILCLALTGCKACSATPSIVYNKKYRHGDDFIVFHADKTGYFEKHYWYTGYPDYPDATCSMRINFTWRVGDDGSVYLFRTGETYYDEDTTHELVSLPIPISFGKDFLATMTLGGDYYHYILEGSELAKTLEESQN